MSYQFLSILKEAKQMAAEDKRQPPVACPICGEPIKQARGIIYCPFCPFKTTGQTGGDGA